MNSITSTIKLVIWDLDNTLWDGTLLEDKNVRLKDNVVHIIKTLDARGILQSIASRNNETLALAKLEEFGIREYFLYPQINWNPKSASTEIIVKTINIALDAVAFIDDDPFECDEVHNTFPQVYCLNVSSIPSLLENQRFKSNYATDDAKNRRRYYMSEIKRTEAEKTFNLPKAYFLATLNMHLSIKPAVPDDLARAEELTLRTHQLNTTGYTYSHEELKEFSQSDNYRLLIASLKDKYGDYGKIGLILIAQNHDAWNLKLFLTSCRVMSKGIGSTLLTQILHDAKTSNVDLYAEFIANDVNRLMYMTYKFLGFKEIKNENNVILFKHSLENIPPLPDYIKISNLNCGVRKCSNTKTSNRDFIEA